MVRVKVSVGIRDAFHSTEVLKMLVGYQMEHVNSLETFRKI